MNAERKLRLQLPAGIASLLRQIAAGFVQRDAVAIGERTEEQIRSSRIHITAWSEGLFHLVSVEANDTGSNNAALGRRLPASMKNQVFGARFPQSREAQD